MKSLADCSITVIGLGLMGGSLAAALHGPQCRRIVGVDTNLETLRIASMRGSIDEALADPIVGVYGADIVVLATPVRTIIQLVRELGPHLPAGTLLMDLGSTKSAILAEMAALPPGVEVLGGHPMCGKEISGIESADPELYRGRTFILSPLPRTSSWALALGSELVEAVGGRSLIIDGERQDELVGSLSHLPYLLACALVSTVEVTIGGDPLARRVAAGGYRDTSRVAGSDVAMMVDILLTNRAVVSRAAHEGLRQLGRLVELVDAGDESALRRALGHIRDVRKEMVP